MIKIDALEGFDKPAVASKPKEEVKAETAANNPMNLDWSEEFMQQASQDFEKSIRSMMAESGSGENSEFAESIIRASQEAASKVFEGQTDTGVSFADTLRSLAEGAESLQVQTINIYPLMTSTSSNSVYRLTMMKQL